MIELTDLPLGPRFDRGEGDEAEAELRDRHAKGHASLADAVAQSGTPLAATWACPQVAIFPIRTPTLPPATHTNVVFLVSGRDAVLIEPASPYPEEIERLLDAVAELARRQIVVQEIWATHHHPDHIGGAVAITEALALPLRAHPETLARLDPAIPRGRPIHEGEKLLLGQDVWHALHVPGHAAGHLAFFEPKVRALIAGDMVAAVGTILIEPSEGDMAIYLQSLRRLAELDPVVVVPAHGGAIRPGRAIFEQYIAHRLLREARVLAALTKAPQSLEQLVAVAYADTPQHIWPIARLSLEAHLIKLFGEGKAVQSVTGWSLSRRT